MEPAREIRKLQAFRSRFLFLFICIVLWFILRPFLEGSLEALALSGIFFSFFFLACLYAVSQTRRAFLVALGLGVPSIGAVWLGVFLENSFLQIFGAILQIIFWAYILVIILSRLVRARKVTRDTIMGAACAYFLIGFAWSFVFFVVEFVSPGAFSFPHPGARGIKEFIYFSFVTLTTLGFGDITPVSDPARSLTVLEAALGQLFIAIMISFLVGSYLSRSRKDESN
jgi:hypothetical protein